MATTIRIPKSDKGFNLTFTIKDSSGTVYNLVGYTVTLKAWVAGSSGSLVVDAACTITDAGAGACYYAVTAGDFATAQTLSAELELTKTGVIESTESFKIEVTESG